MSVYLDYNATSPLRPQVRNRMIEVMEYGPLNGSSMHRYGRQARAWIEDARTTIAENLHTDKTNVIFTSSATEANHQALFGCKANGWAVAATEHPAIIHTAKERCAPLEIIPVTHDGLITPNALEKSLKSLDASAPCVSIMLANNETGIIQPIAELAEVARRHKAFIHCDAVQAYGKIGFTMPDLGVDAITISAHKMGGPIGAAALVMYGCQPLEPYLLGGGQEINRRAGTENVVAIAGFAEAVTHIDLSFMQKLSLWRDAMEAALHAAEPALYISGKHVERLPNTSCIATPGAEASTQLMHFDLSNIAISSGSACTSGKITRSHVLEAMQLAPSLADCAIRISSGWNSTESDYQSFTTAWTQLHTRINGRKPA